VVGPSLVPASDLVRKLLFLPQLRQTSELVNWRRKA
jgi:hypothetical protein